jgi:Ca2+-binding EF-hand superfamily protein
LITLPQESIPKSKSEAILRRLIESSNKSASAGRSFLTLCSLVDPKGTGTLNKEELSLIAKMMDCVLTKSDVEALFEILPFSNNGRMTGCVDYKQLNQMLQHHPASPGKMEEYSLQNVSKSQSPYMRDSHISSLRSSISPIYNDENTFRQPSAVQTQGLENARTSNTIGNNSSILNFSERILSILVDRIQSCIREKNAAWGSVFSLRKQFERFDKSLTGGIPSHRFLSVLDDIGVNLSSQEVQVISSLYARPEDFDKIDYESFCRDAIDNYGYNGIGTGLVPITSMSLSRTRASNNINLSTPMSATSLRTINRLQELTRSGVDVLKTFAAYDLRNTGTVRIHLFFIF